MKKLILSLVLFTNLVSAKEIKLIQYGIIDGKTGKNAVYVYLKDKSDNTFDFKRDRLTIFVEDLPLLKRTAEYLKFIEKKRK